MSTDRAAKRMKKISKRERLRAKAQAILDRQEPGILDLVRKKCARREPLTPDEARRLSNVCVPSLVARMRQAGSQTYFGSRAKKATAQAALPPVVTPIRPANENGPWGFYSTETWKRLRYEALVKSDGRCLCCGRSARDGAVLRVDHVEPISKAPHRKADPTNLQVLCNDCNWGKGGWDSTDWREAR